MRICFVGNSFHKRTRSCAFFVEILEQIGDVTSLYLSLDDDHPANDDAIRALVNHRFDRIVFWQTDRLAQQLLPLGLDHVFLVPMYDSVHAYPPDYWQRFIGHHVLSFSRALHEQVQRAGGRTSHFQYYPDAASIAVPDRGIGRNAIEGFFWERRPAEPLSFRRVAAQARLLGIDRLHVHAVPDRDRDAGDAPTGTVDGLEVHVSTWFDRPEDYAAAAARPLFFFAPRPLEGIGMATLEAMARGQIVVAPALPTANEYVGHRVSGLLYDPRTPLAEADLPRLDAARLAEMSTAARRRAIVGRRIWLADIDRLAGILREDGRRWATGDCSAPFATAIRHAAHRRAFDAV